MFKSAMRMSCFAGLAVMAYAGNAAAVDYVDSPSMDKVVRAKVQDCRRSGGTIVPLITWGADIVTIQANGASTKTARGSLAAKAGLDLRLKREDDFVSQLESYLKCESPYLRATTGMANLAAELTERENRTSLVSIYQHSWSNGGDAMVVKDGINRPSDLRGKTIAVQRYGPHVDYLLTILKDSGLSVSDVTIKWTRDLVGFGESTPASAFLEDSSVDAAMVIIPDGLGLTSDGTVGTGSEGSVRGAKIMLSTRTASRIISDQYFVRSDYLEANRDEVEAFVQTLFKAEEETRALMKARSGESAKLLKASSEILLDDSNAVADAEAMWADAETVGWRGNVKFYTDNSYPRRYERLNDEVQTNYVKLGLLSRTSQLAKATWDYNALSAGLSDIAGVEVPRFDKDALSRTITRRQAQGTLQDGTLFEIEVNFQPNQKSFPVDIYRDPFSQAIELASTYAGAVITVEGHADPLGYLRAKKDGGNQVRLTRITQSARNLSFSRAQEVRDGVLTLASSSGISMDPSQFVIVGMGFSDPKSGLCSNDPCAPKSKEEWLSNMRVVFRIMQVEAESDVFVPLD